MTLGALDDMTRTLQERMFDLHLRCRHIFNNGIVMTSRIIIPLFKSFYIQWTGSNMSFAFLKEKFENVICEKGATYIPFLMITSKSMVRNSGENIALGFINFTLCFVLLTCMLYPVGNFVGHQSTILQNARMTVMTQDIQGST